MRGLCYRVVNAVCGTVSEQGEKKGAGAGRCCIPGTCWAARLWCAGVVVRVSGDVVLVLCLGCALCMHGSLCPGGGVFGSVFSDAGWFCFKAASRRGGGETIRSRGWSVGCGVFVFLVLVGLVAYWGCWWRR